MSKSWYINPHEPFNTSIAYEIIYELVKEQLIYGVAHLTLDAAGKIRLLSAADDELSEIPRNEVVE